jgi:high affinity Mn2+ porin
MGEIMTKKIFVWFLILGFVFYSRGTVFAKTTEEEIAELKAKLMEQDQRIAELESKSAQQSVGIMEEELDKHIDAHLLHRIPGYQIFDGLRIGIGAASVIQGVSNANGDDLTSPKEDVTDAAYSADLEFEKKFEKSGLAYIHFETGDGAGVEDELKVFSNVNRDADDSGNSVSLTEVWYEHYFTDFPLTLTAGKIDPTVYIDNNEYANDETTQFLGRIFRNSPVIDFPDNSFGLRAGVEPVDFPDLSFIVIDADSDWEDISDDMFLGTQINLKPRFFERDGNYRFLAWTDNRDHAEWSDAAKNKEKGYGFGLSFDQELTDTSGMFARYGWQDPEVYLSGSDFSLEHAYSLGLQLKGNAWEREEDVLGLAFGQIFPSRKYKDANAVKAGSEKHLEVYYSFKVNDHLTVSPDFQVILNPYGGDASNGDSAIIIGGVRSRLDF